jgi:CheY-like chemotaxis protein
VLTNLLNNSAKFTPPGGQITLSASSDGERVTITVRDTGIGLSNDMLPRVFEMFTQIANPLTRAHGGLGIGLSLARTIIEMHGGTIRAFSEGPGKGSELVFTVPLVVADQHEQMDSADSAPPPAPRSSSRRVLIVDDNIDAAQSLGMLLSAGGHQCHVAGGGEEALEVAGCIDPDIFLLDIGMPGMNGYELARRLRAIPQFQPALLVALTGWGNEEDRQKSLAAGFDAHLVKPVSVSALGELLARARKSGSKAG